MLLLMKWQSLTVIPMKNNDQLKKNLRHFSETYSEGLLTATLGAARLTITDLEDVIESQKAEIAQLKSDF